MLIIAADLSISVYKNVTVHRKNRHPMPYPLHSKLFLAISCCFNKTGKNGELLGVMVRAPLLSIQSLPQYLSLQILVITS